MAETLVIEWDRNRLIAATGTAGNSTVQFHSAVSVDREDGLLPAEIGERLAKALTSAGITATEATVVFPRGLVTFHRVELPNIGDDDIPDLVRMQAASRLTVPVDSVCLDFAPLPVVPGKETRDVLLVTLPKQDVSRVRETLAVCGIELASVRISSFGIAAAAVYSGTLPRTSDSKSVEAIVALGSDSIEMIFMTGNSVAFSHSGASWGSAEGVEQAVRAEVSRARMAAGEDMGDYTVKRLTLIGSPEITAAVPDSISKRLNDADVVRIDPHGSLLTGVCPEGVLPSDMLAIAGAIANSQSPTVETVDLVNPRTAPEKKDYGRVTKIAVAGILILLVCGGWSWRTNRVKALRQEAAMYAGDAAEMRAMYKMADKDLLLAKNLEEWSDRDISWLEELKKIQVLMENTERVFIKQFSFNLRSGNYLAKIDADGYAKSRRDIEDLMRELTDAGYEVAPKEITQSLRDPNYNMELRLEVSIPAPKKKPAGKKS